MDLRENFSSTLGRQENGATVPKTSSKGQPH